MSADRVRAFAPRLLDPENFAAPGVRLAFAAGQETIPWEVFQGRLLPVAVSRTASTFESWNLHLAAPDGFSPEPVVSLKMDAERLHVVRGVEASVWEGRGEAVIESSQRRGWVRELVASVPLSHPRLEDEAALAVGRALRGVPLPLGAEESPHPLFSFGLLDHQPPGPFDAARLEFLLRSARDQDMPRVAQALAGQPLIPLARALFLGVSLSPWTALVPRLLSLIDALPGPEPARFLGWLVRLVCRHLTAYDLVTFHHRGANYPDALLLDEALGRLLRRIGAAPGLASERLVRRAVRQGFLLRRNYEGHPVPDAPTSPGEQMRVYPDGVPRVPEEQLADVRSRTRVLFTGKLDTDKELMRESIADLNHEDERQELGAALFLERPLGVGKTGVEPDATPLLATLAYSRSIAVQRLRALGAEQPLAAMVLPGVPLPCFGAPGRQAALRLADAQRVSPDFVMRQTLPGGVARLQALFDWGPLPLDGWGVVGLSPAGTLAIHGLKAELAIDDSAGYASEAGTEYPVAGLRWGDVRIQPAHQR